MPTNIEIKAYLKNIERAVEVAKKLSQSQGIKHYFSECCSVFLFIKFQGSTLKQQDTFYNVPNGRLKVENSTNCSDISSNAVFLCMLLKCYKN